jgi:hypothetical protein
MELIAQCDDVLRWLCSDELKGLAWVYLTGSADVGARQQIRHRLMSLLMAAVEAAGEAPVTADEVLQATRETMPKPLGVATAVKLVKRLREWAVALNTPAAKSGDQRMPPNEAKVKPADVPTELRELGRPDGPILTTTYLAMKVAWNFSSVDLTKAYKAGELTYRLKVGRTYAYLYTELCRLREKRDDRKSNA